MKKFASLFLAACLSLSTYAVVLSAQDANRGSALYKEQCAGCHGDQLQGRSAPPLARPDLASRYPVAALAAKIHNTMPPDKQGTLSEGQAADVAAWIRQATPLAVSASVSVVTPPGAAPHVDFPAFANLNQLMRAVMFPNSNIIFTVQTHDPGEKKKASNAATSDGGFNWSQWGSDLYTGWDIVDYAALALTESAPLMLTPGRSCQNGKPVPVNDPEWVRFTREMAEVGRKSYSASQTRSQEKVSDISGDVADACLNCHSMYRDRVSPGKSPGDPASLALRCSKR